MKRFTVVHDAVVLKLGWVDAMTADGALAAARPAGASRARAHHVRCGSWPRRLGRLLPINRCALPKHCLQFAAGIDQRMKPLHAIVPAGGCGGLPLVQPRIRTHTDLHFKRRAGSLALGLRLFGRAR